MGETKQAELQARYLAAVDRFVDKVKPDQNVIAVIVSGSLAYDVLWEKSDIDMTVVVRDQQLKTTSYSLIDDGIVQNVSLCTRTEFKRGLEGSRGGSFWQSYMAKGRVVYSTDESLVDTFLEAKTVGKDDMAHSALTIAGWLLGDAEKAEKWLTARQDPLYAQYYLLKAAESVAAMELCLAGEPIGRDSIQKAQRRNPDAINPFYQEAMARHLSEQEIRQGIDTLYAYLEQHLDVIAQPILDFMADGEIKTSTLISKHFGVDPHFTTHVFEYLAERGIIERVSQTIRITPKGRQNHEELGYLYISE